MYAYICIYECIYISKYVCVCMYSVYVYVKCVYAYVCISVHSSMNEWNVRQDLQLVLQVLHLCIQSTINQKYSREKNYWKHTNCHYSLNNNNYLHSLSIRYYKLSTDKSHVWDDVGRFWANTSSFRVRNLHTCRLWPQGSWKPPSRTLRKRVRWKWQLVSFEWWDFVAFKNVSLF